jgi:ATP-dependent helicase STH1/SNF2
MMEQLERKQGAERKRRAKQKHLKQSISICVHGNDMVATTRALQDRVLKLGRAVRMYHANTEKEEAKRVERVSNMRLKALKANDEEAFMKLIGTAKDIRFTHLLH